MSFRVTLVPLVSLQRLLEIISVKHHSSCQQVRKVFLLTWYKIFFEQLKIFLKLVRYKRARRANVSHNFLQQLFCVRVVIKVVINYFGHLACNVLLGFIKHVMVDQRDILHVFNRVQLFEIVVEEQRLVRKLTVRQMEHDFNVALEIAAFTVDDGNVQVFEL